MYALSIDIAGALTLHGYFHLSPATLSINIAGWSRQLLGYYHTHTHTYSPTYTSTYTHAPRHHGPGPIKMVVPTAIFNVFDLLRATMKMNENANFQFNYLFIIYYPFNCYGLFSMLLHIRM